jgi:hypothetical protein
MFVLKRTLLKEKEKEKEKNRIDVRRLESAEVEIKQSSWRLSVRCR